MNSRPLLLLPSHRRTSPLSPIIRTFATISPPISKKRPGTIQSAFNSDYKEDFGDKFINLKNQLLSQVGESKFNQAWSRLLVEYDQELENVKRLGSNIVPTVPFSSVVSNNGIFPPDVEKGVRKHGCVLIKGVISEEEALQYKNQVREYIKAHPGEIAGFPEDKPQVWELYWSKAQLEARSHPNFVNATNAVNTLWHAEKGTPIDLSVNLSYCDRLRVREKGDISFELKEHVDGGSVERWEDPEYRKCYDRILTGEWEEYDPFDATHRVSANMDLYNCSGGCSMFRSFQGWISLSHVAPGEGTLRVAPLLKLTTAYMMMRPLLKDVIASKEVVCSTPGQQQAFLPTLHPHVLASVVPVPEVGPGDVVFWHCDSLHAVEGDCENKRDDSSVLYIPATPLCPKNAEYLLRQRKAFEDGRTPPDFPLNDCELNFQDRGKPEDLLSDTAKLSMGFSKFPIITETQSEGVIEARKMANQILFNDI